ncbi:MAG: hypothetical protein QXI60_05210 [Thermofilaceae archaeon]
MSLEDAAKKYISFIEEMRSRRQPPHHFFSSDLDVAEAFWGGRDFSSDAFIISDEKTTLLLMDVKMHYSSGLAPIASLNRVRGILKIFNYGFLVHEAESMKAFERGALSAFSEILGRSTDRRYRNQIENTLFNINTSVHSSMAVIDEGEFEVRRLLNAVLAPLNLKIVRRKHWLIKSREGLMKITGKFVLINALNGRIMRGAEPFGAGRSRGGWKWLRQDEANKVEEGSVFTVEVEGARFYIIVERRFYYRDWWKRGETTKVDIIVFEVHGDEVEFRSGSIPLRCFAMMLRNPNLIYLYTVKHLCRDMRELARIIKAQGLSLDRLPDEVRSKILIQTLIEG